MEYFDDPIIDAIHDLLEESGFLDPKYTFAEQLDLRKLAALLEDDRRRHSASPPQSQEPL